MHSDLYFIQLIESAFRADDGCTALRQAFAGILAHRKHPYHEVGFLQFARFMADVRSHTSIHLIMLRDAQLHASLQISPLDGPVTLEGITPGTYRLQLATGQVIWQRRLAVDELVWTQAFPARPLDLAADTEGAQRAYSLRETLLDDDIVIHVLPGMEEGQITIELATGTEQLEGDG